MHSSKYKKKIIKQKKEISNQIEIFLQLLNNAFHKKKTRREEEKNVPGMELWGQVDDST